MDWKDLPEWEDIPKAPGLPQGCAWGLFDRNGERDQVGTLNLLTPEVILKAKEEIKSGESVCLKSVTAYGSSMIILKSLLTCKMCQKLVSRARPSSGRVAQEAYAQHHKFAPVRILGLR